MQSSRTLSILFAMFSLTFPTAARAARRDVDGARGKNVRVHVETDAFGWTHVNPDGDGDNTNTFGLGFGRSTGIDAGLGRPGWSIGIGGLLARSRLNLGVKVAFVVDTIKDDDAGPEDVDTRTTVVTGNLVPYLHWIFRPNKRVRPYVGGEFGVGGTTNFSAEEGADDAVTTNTVYPIVGATGGMHIFLVNSCSLNTGLAFNYWAPHARVEDDNYAKTADIINLGLQLGLSVWF